MNHWNDEQEEVQLAEAYDLGVQKGIKEATDKHTITILQLLGEKKVLKDEVENLREIIKIMCLVL